MSQFEGILLAICAVAIIVAAPLAVFEIRDKVTEYRARVNLPDPPALTADEPESSTDEWLEAEHYGVPITTANIDVVFMPQAGAVMELPRSVPGYSASVLPSGMRLAAEVRDELSYVAILERDGSPARIVASALPLSWTVGDAVTIVHSKTGYKFGGPWRVRTVATDDLLFGEPLPSKKLAYATVQGFRLGES